MLGALVIVFREAVEAGLVVGIVLAATRGLPRRGRWVGAGVAGGMAGAGLVAVFASEIADAFRGAGQELFNAGVLAVAVAMLAWHNVWMSSHGRDMARQLRQAGADVAAGRLPLTALAIVVAAAVLREGAETVLFLYGVAAGGGTTAASMILGGLLGIASASALSALLYFGLLSIPARSLFAVTSALITLLAAGLASQAASFLQQAGYAEVLTSTAWDTSWLLPEGGLAGRLLHTLIGYTAAPTVMQTVVYLVTIGTILCLMRLIGSANGTSGTPARETT